MDAISTSLVDVVLPCLDEALALPTVLADLPQSFRAVVVDNGSSDASAEIALHLGAKVVREPRHGYGAAVHAGLAACTADIVAVMDCDASVKVPDLARLVAEISEGRSDLACGRRRAIHAGVWPWHARLGNHLLARLLSRMAGIDVRDLAPVRVARRADLLELGVADLRSGYPVELLLRAGFAGWRVSEFDFPYHPRAVGTRSKVTGSIRGTMTAVRDMTAVLRSTKSAAAHPPILPSNPAVR